MRIRPIVLCLLAGGLSRAFAQSATCDKLHKTALDQLNHGRLKDAEITLSSALTDSGAASTRSRDWIILQDMAVVVSRSGRLGEAENYAGRSVAILEKTYPPDDPILLRPLHRLSSALVQQGKIAGARAALQRIQKIRITQPLDRALLHGMAAALLRAEGRYDEAVPEYLTAISAWEESGHGESADMAAVLNGLADIYIAEKRFDEAGSALDRVLTILASATDVGPADQIRVLNSQAVLYAREGQWRKAGDNLKAAISLADHLDAGLNPGVLEPLLGNYAQVLHSNHQTREARIVEARVAAIHSRGFADSVVDVSQLKAIVK